MSIIDKIKSAVLNVRDRAFMGVLQLFLVTVIFLMIIVLVLYYFIAAMPVITAGPLNTTQSQITALTGSGTQMASIVLIILAAAIVMAGVGLILGGRGRQQM